MHTPCFPPWRAQLAALGRRTVRTLRQTTLAQLGEPLTQLIPAHLLAAADEGDHSRERIYSLRRTFEGFLWQLLNPGTACREVVRQVQALCRLQGESPPDDNTSAYVQARQRLPQERFEQVLHATAQAAAQRAGAAGRLAGRPVKVVDGSPVQLPDTPANQKAYPQPSTQTPGCGFPVMRLVVLFSLASGALLDVAMGNLHSHDLRLLATLWEALAPGTSCWATGRLAITSPWPGCPCRAWTWWRACITAARWISARPNASAATTVCWSGAKAISSRTS